MDRMRVVIVGAGFGGLAAARELASAPVDVTLVDRNNFHTFQPLLYQVATSGLASADVAYPVRGIVARHEHLSFRQATVIGADLDARVLHLQHDEHEVEDLPYDHLIVAAGATANTFGIPGVDHHGFPLYNLADAVRLRNHVLERFEAADAEPALVDDGALTFVVVGGGPTGVEVAGALTELVHLVLRKDFPNLDVRRARVVLVEMQDRLLAPFSTVSQDHARTALEERGVEVRTGVQVARARATRVTFEDGEELAAHTLVWAAGVKANPIGEALGLRTGRGGRIEVGPNLAVADHPEVWAIGDVAAIVDPKGGAGTLLPQLAPVAIQSGRHVARQICCLAAGRIPPTAPFRYRDKGTMATIGRSRAVAELPLGIKLRGFPAWLAWLGLHLVMLAGFRNRISVFANWAWNWLTYDRGPRLIFRSRPRADD
ncbi:NAD(P)/FAD-dependent oxidoreductase [Aquihabitans daechungensis]|uniref:NAD(P)/FAD-dependent oxidoreductase n=1 Tax=Aquihabitans daechungensis TaxID=1052257 RepID=UPI003B9F81ED